MIILPLAAWTYLVGYCLYLAWSIIATIEHSPTTAYAFTGAFLSVLYLANRR